MDNQCHVEIAEFSYYLSVAIMCVTLTSKDMLQIEGTSLVFSFSVLDAIHGFSTIIFLESFQTPSWKPKSDWP